ncbi:DUF2975 domain-containing protein [Paenibacillus sp. NEAU-GSW1]|uniref:DUF2975 domain-containing protein n=1 Tax=Paenibacillus sp. NEAU-GSW1 TaxID=2682486 RepID=UPI0012E0E96F|nr:DUF2975 domain-containing protein [Paenibacillus sp. NEAU-GSW1]MUT66860.1 DUF2975 domain-containing protein [Paenibacillus sp. NEAU-GSW1]
MERGTTLFLKLTVILMAIPVVALCVIGLPSIAKEGAAYFSGYLFYPALICLYASAIPYFIALYQSWKLLSYIDNNIAFSDLSVSALKKIKLCAITISALFAACSPVFYIMAENDDAPGLLAIVLVIVFASMVIAFFAAVLQRLLKQAIEIKTENDLTV